MSIAITIADVRSQVVRDGFAYWLDKKGDRPFPARADCDPVLEIPSLIPHMMLKDVRHDPLDFRYRLIGTALRSHMLQDWTGTWMSAIDFQRAPSTIWSYHQSVAENRAPLFIRPPYVGPHKDFLYAEAVMLPLGADHRTVDMMMIFLDFLTARDPKRPDPEARAL